MNHHQNSNSSRRKINNSRRISKRIAHKQDKNDKLDSKVSNQNENHKKLGKDNFIGFCL